MTYLTKNPDDSIIDITDLDETGSGIQIMLDPNIDDLFEVKTNRFGHSMFDYINGSIVINQVRYDEALLELDKTLAIKQLVEEEIKVMARERVSVQIQIVSNVTTREALDALQAGV